MDGKSNKRTMSLPELAEILGISVNSCYFWASQNALPVHIITVGRRKFVSRSEVEALLASRKTEDPTGE